LSTTDGTRDALIDARGQAEQGAMIMGAKFVSYGTNAFVWRSTWATLKRTVRKRWQSRKFVPTRTLQGSRRLVLETPNCSTLSQKEYDQMTLMNVKTRPRRRFVATRLAGATFRFAVDGAQA
jgi:hypothetical protein